MKLRLVSVISSDGIEFPGLLYEPQKDTKKAAIWLHGMGDNAVFYKPKLINALGEALTNNGIALLAFNNRGAHNSKNLKLVDESLPEEGRSYQGGTYYELIADCVKDIEGAVDFLKHQGFETFYLLGHSTGANKICAYHVRAKSNQFSKYVLAGPGDDVGTTYSTLGDRKYRLALDYAKQAVKEGKPLKIMPLYTGMHPFSAQSTLDMLDPNGAYNTFPFYESITERLGTKPLFEEYKKINLPTLIIFGEADEYAYTAGGAAQALDLFMAYTSNSMLKQTDFNLVPNTDHGFRGAEEDFAKRVADWLAYE